MEGLRVRSRPNFDDPQCTVRSLAACKKGKWEMVDAAAGKAAGKMPDVARSVAAGDAEPIPIRDTL